MANKPVLILVAAADTIIIAGTAVAIPSFTQQKPAGQNSTINTPQINATASGADLGSVLRLSSASVLMDVPLLKGFENGNEIYFIGTDISDKAFADLATNITGFKVNHSPLLAQTPEDARGQVFIFESGVPGDGPFGFQEPVMNAKPGDESYSPLQEVILVNWVNQSAAIQLKSVDEMMEHEDLGHIALNTTQVIANHPAIKWDGGSLVIMED